MLIFFDPPGWWRMTATLTSIRPPIDAYILTGPSIFGRGSALRRIRLKTAPVFGSIDCALQFHSASSTTPPRRFGCHSVPPRHLRSVTARGATLHLRLQTIFTLPFPLYPRHLRLCLRCRVRSHSSVPRHRLWRFAPQRNLRLLFRPVRPGICSTSSNRRTAAIRHHPPTH